MARVNLYIRVEDEKKFLNIKDRPQWLHESIQKVPDEAPGPAVEAKP